MRFKLPAMIDRPESRTVASGITYWIFAFVGIPFFILLVLLGPDSSSQYVGIDVAYHIVNFLAALVIFLPYLKESSFSFQMEWKKCLRTAALCSVIVTAFKLAISHLLTLQDDPFLVDMSTGFLLTTESELLLMPVVLLYEQPVWGTLCTVLLAPLTISCLVYACVFAPICNNRPWLAYVVTAIALLIPRLLFVFFLWAVEEQIIIYLVQLPVHLLACWTYQKTDTVFAPIAVHGFSNLYLVVLLLLYF